MHYMDGKWNTKDRPKRNISNFLRLSCTDLFRQFFQEYRKSS